MSKDKEIEEILRKVFERFLSEEVLRKTFIGARYLLCHDKRPREDCNFCHNVIQFRLSRYLDGIHDRVFCSTFRFNNKKEISDVLFINKTCFKDLNINMVNGLAFKALASADFTSLIPKNLI